MAKNSRYRLVSDYGYGDKTWHSRDLDEESAIKELNIASGGNAETLDEAMDSGHLYYIEEDSWDDEEDWDWMDS